MKILGRIILIGNNGDLDFTHSLEDAKKSLDSKFVNGLMKIWENRKVRILA